MALSINTNLASNAVQRQMSKTGREMLGSLKQLASGDRFSDLSENAGDFAIAEELRAQIASQRAAKQNAENAVSFASIAEGGLSEQNNILIRLRELAIQSSSDTVGELEREMLDMEFQQLNSEMDRIAKSTSFNSQKLLAGDEKEYVFQIGANGGEEDRLRYKANANTTAASLGTDGLSVVDRNEARNSLEVIDEGLETLATARAGFGAIQSRLSSVINNSDVQVENLEAARSRIADVDLAKTVSEVTRNRVIQQYQASMLAQANASQEQVLRLIA
jgi:flagellin